MQFLKGALIGVVVLCGLAGCKTIPAQPSIEHSAISPSDLKPGDTAIITVELQDKFNIVERIEGKVKQDPSLTFRLRDDGVAPDAKAADGIWTLQVDVPFNAPPGDFDLSLTALNSSGDPILIHDENGEVVRLSTHFGLVIRYPESP